MSKGDHVDIEQGCTGSRKGSFAASTLQAASEVLLVITIGASPYKFPRSSTVMFNMLDVVVSFHANFICGLVWQNCSERSR